MPACPLCSNGGQPEPLIEWIEEQEEADPHGPERVGRGWIGQRQRQADHGDPRQPPEPGRTYGAGPGRRATAWNASAGCTQSGGALPKRLHEVRSLEHPRHNRGKRPEVAEIAHQRAGRQAAIDPVHQVQVVAFKDQPDRHREQHEQRELPAPGGEPGLTPQSEVDPIQRQDVAGPHDGGQPGGSQWDAPEEPELAGSQNEQADPGVRGEAKGAPCRSKGRHHPNTISSVPSAVA